MERNENVVDVISISDTESSRSSLIAPHPRVTAIRKNLIVQQPTESPIQEEIVTLSSISERCPVTWSGNRKFKQNFLNPDTFFSPSPRTKVTHWLTETSMQYCNQQQIDAESSVDETLLPNPLDKCSSVSTNKSSIIVRQDYNKHNVESTSSSKLITNQHETNRNNIVYLENSVSSSKQLSDTSSKYLVTKILQNNVDLELQKSSNESVVSENDQTLQDSEQINIDIEEPPTASPLSRTLMEDMLDMCNSQEMNHVNENSQKVEKQNIKPSGDVPLSPETQKKIELCEYLKLMNMNPTDSKTIGMRQNRRSSRVKHLALMSEKRELERKLNNELQEIEKKKSTKSSDGDSKHSSENDKGSKSSSKKTNVSSVSPTSSSSSSTLIPRIVTSQETANESNTKIKISEKRNESKLPLKVLFEVTNSEKPKVPSKFLQVHEVSTTSISKVKKNLNRNSDMKNLEKQIPLRKSDSNISTHIKQNKMNDSPKLNTVTKKSFKELFMDVKNLKQLRNIRQQSCDSSPEDNKLKSNLNFFVKSASNLPNIVCDFDGFVKPLVNEKIKNDKDKLQSVNKTLNNETKNLKRHEPLKRKEQSDGDPKAKRTKLNGVFKKVLKSASSKLKWKKPKAKTNEKLKRPNTRLANKLEKHKIYGNPKHINKLRSRGRLKQLGITNVLLKEQKKKYIKKKLKPKLFVFNKEKDFKSTELIQHGHENEVLVTKECVDTNDVVSSLEVKCDGFSTKFGPSNRIKKRLPDPEVWKNFTSEHRKAYMESIKYVKGDGNILVRNDFCPNKILFNKESTVQTYNKEESHVEEKNKNDDTSYDLHTSEVCTEYSDKIDETCTEIDNHAITPALSTVSSFKNKTEPSSEDLEVDQLMRNKQVKDQATQKDSESPDGLTNDLVMSEPSRSPSPDLSSSNSWSLQTVQSNSEPVPSTSKQDILEIPIENSPHIDGEVEIDETHSITPCSTKDSDQEDQANDKESFPGPGIPEVVNISQIEPTRCEYVHLSSRQSEIKSLHHCLTQPKTKHKDRSIEDSPTNKQNWEEDFASTKSPKSDRKALSQSHNIYLSNNNGAVISAYYLDYNLIVVQELVVGFWNQSPLGNILGAQDMWISRGSTRRMVLGNGCVNKESPESVVSCNNSIAYIELWTKEHKSDKRERPVADVFVTIYMRLNRNGPDKKVLQLENIKGYASDVQYIVLRNSLCIIVTWTVNADSVSSTVVHNYHLSDDFQMVSSITEMQSVGHYVSSLHNIEDCDTLILGCGEAKITLWNLEHGYIVATIDLIEIHPRPHAVWAKCDRGFLFTIHQAGDNVLQLIAINSFDSTWKKLQTYKSKLDHKNFLGVCMEHGVLVAFYDTGISCWSAQTADPLSEDTCEDCVVLPFGKHVVVVLNEQVHVKHALEYLIYATEDS